MRGYIEGAGDVSRNAPYCARRYGATCYSDRWRLIKRGEF